MRKLFVVFFFMLVSSFNTSVASDVQVNECSTDAGVCSPGCYMGDLGCVLCKPGTYKDGWGTECKRCNLPREGDYNEQERDFLQDPEKYSGYIQDACPWFLTCPENTYFGDAGNGHNKCIPCDPYYSSDKAYSPCYVGKNGVTCSVTSQGAEQPKAVEMMDYCEAVVYEITLSKNTELETLNADYPGHEITYSDKTVYAKCNTGFASTEDATKWGPGLEDDMLQPCKNFKKFLGYSEKDDPSECQETIVFGSQGDLQMDVTNYFNEPRTLYACWKNEPIEVTYYQTTTSGDTSAGPNTYTTDCTLDDSKSTPPDECKFLDIGYLEEMAGGEMIATGYVFKSHDCRIGELGNNQWGDLSSCPNRTGGFAVGGYIPFVNGVTSISVAVVGAKCPAGYYCSKTEQNSCPVGTTSAAAKSSIEDCYMPSGQSGTKFCDKNGCFYLPTGIGNISYNPS